MATTSMKAATNKGAEDWKTEPASLVVALVVAFWAMVHANMRANNKTTKMMEDCMVMEWRGVKGVLLSLQVVGKKDTVGVCSGRRREGGGPAPNRQLVVHPTWL